MIRNVRWSTSFAVHKIWTWWRRDTGKWAVFVAERGLLFRFILQVRLLFRAILQGKSSETLTLFWNEVGKWFLQFFWCQDPKRKYGSYVEETSMSIARLDAWVSIEVRFLVEREKHGGYSPKECADTCGRMMGSIIE